MATKMKNLYNQSGVLRYNNEFIEFRLGKYENEINENYYLTLVRIMELFYGRKKLEAGKREGKVVAIKKVKFWRKNKLDCLFFGRDSNIHCSFVR